MREVVWSITWQSKSSILCLLGGLTLGALCTSRLLLVGKITGISGIFKDLFKVSLEFGVPTHDRITKFIYIGGMLIGTIKNILIPIMCICCTYIVTAIFY